MSGTASFILAAHAGVSVDRRGALLAREHRCAQQELPGAHRVRRDLAQFAEIAPACFRLARFQPLFIGDRLLLHELDRNGAALAAVEVEQIARAHPRA